MDSSTLIERAAELILDTDPTQQETVRTHLLNVYTTLTMALTAASFGGAVSYTNDLQATTAFLSALGSILLAIWVVSTPHSSFTVRQRFFTLLIAGFFFGMSLGPLVTVAFTVKETTIMTAMMITAVVFGGFTLASLFAPVGCYLQFGGICLSGLLYLTVASVISMLFESTAFFGLEVFLGLLIFSGLVIYATQAIVVKRLMGDEDFVAHALHLFIDATAIFRGILVLLIRRGKRPGVK